MDKLKQLSKKINNNSILLYSGHYDFDEALNSFQVDHNFFYVTQLEIPNLTILFHYPRNQLFFFVDFQSPVWFDNFSFLNSLSDKFSNEKRQNTNRTKKLSLETDYLNNCSILGNLRENIYPLTKLKEYTRDLSTLYSLNNLPDFLKSGLPKIDEITIDQIYQQQRVLKKFL